MLFSCKFFSDGESTIPITSISLNKSTLDLKVGEIDYIGFSFLPKDGTFTPEFDYDNTKVELDIQNEGIIVKGIAEGQTSLTLSSGKCSATCLINITGFEIGYEKTVEPYIYSNTNILQLSPGLSEKVFVSLYGGTAADINDYTWLAEDSTVCYIEPTGQYCLIKALSPGYTRIKVTHSKSTYPYYMGIYVFDDPTKATYITTTDNVITMNLNDPEQSINVTLINGLETSVDNDFKWEIIDKNENCPIDLSANGSKGIITPKNSGNCTVRITHPDAIYPLDILCRVISIIKNVYIETDKTIVTLEGEKEEVITSSLVNLDISEYSLNEFEYSVLNSETATIITNVDNQIYVKGLKNGSTKLIVSHPKSAYKREVLLISTNQKTDAVDVSCYITTTNNYVRTKVGGEQIPVNISLKGGEEGDEKDFCWSVSSLATDGSKNAVISLDTPTGSVFSRMAQSTYAYGNAYINPLYEGTAVITITHPKVLFPTEILVKVLNKEAILETPLYFSGEGIVKVLNGEALTYTVVLNGENKSSTDNQDIKYTIDDTRINISGNEDKVIITAPTKGTGNTISHLNIAHKKVDYPKSVLVITADTEEELANIKVLYTDKNYYNFEVGKSVSFMVNTLGFNDNYDFSTLNWTIENPSIITLDTNPNDKRNITIKGVNSGTTKLTASIDNCNCVYTITVYPSGAVQTDPEVYFSTTQNVMIFNQLNTSKSLNIAAINLKPNLYSDISWSVENENICKVIPNGTTASITSLQEGETVINISHPLSQNVLKVYIKVGSEYIIQETKCVYISSPDVITMLRDDQPQKLQAILVNFDGEDAEHFTFKIDNTNIATVSAQSPNGTAYIKPINSGQAELTITNEKSDIDKKVLIVVGNSREELAGITYLTTTNNVVSIGEGKYKTVSVSVKNATEIILDGYTWTSSDRNVADITANGSTASIKGNSVGTAIISVTNTSCQYSLQIIVHVVDPIAAAEHPYIQLSSSVLIVNIDDNYTSLTADLIGGEEDDFSNFTWSSNDPSICNVYGQNEVGKIKAVMEGTTFITVSHPKANCSAQVLVICETLKASDCYISVPSSIINMKPTDDSTTITATLINGNANDKYNFRWSLDVYDVIDFQYSANVCTVKPKQAGSATITLSHPKADYDQQIIVNVQEYSEFAFPSTNTTLKQGDVKFLNMQIPNTSVKTHVEYSVQNNAICSVTGTKEVAQITGIKKGSTTITAKLIASNTGLVQATSDLLVYVEEKAVTDCYITSSSTIYTIAKGKSQILSASITGNNILSSDQANLKWSTSDTNIISITGIGSSGYVRGASIYVIGNKAGEAIITCSHDKASSSLQFYVVVTGSNKKIITLNKTYATIVKGSSGTTLTANIENSENNSDYEMLEWSSIAANGKDGNSIARVMGSGKNVQIYPVSPGEVTIMCQSKDTDSVGKCTVVVEAGKSFIMETSNCKVAPLETKTFSYKVSPPDAVITWTRTSLDDYFDYNDLGADADGNGKLEVTGVTEGTGMLMASTDGGATGKLTIQCQWTYSFEIKGNTTFNIKPNETVSFDYSVIPGNAEINLSSTYLNHIFTASVVKGDITYDDKHNSIGNGKIIITPITESSSILNLTVTATNPSNGNTVGTKIISGNIKYPKLNINAPTFIRDVGKWSKYNEGAVVIGDGETVTLSFDIAETKIDGKIDKITFEPSGNEGNRITYTTAQLGTGMKITLTHPQDYVTTSNVWYVDDVWIDSRYPNMEAFNWEVHYKKSGLMNQSYDDYFRLLLPGTTSETTNDNIYYCYLLWSDSTSQQYEDSFAYCDIVEKPILNSEGKDTGQTEKVYDIIKTKEGKYSGENNLVHLDSWTGRTLTDDELKNNPWFYCPGTISSASADIMYTYKDIAVDKKYERGYFGNNNKVHIEPHIMKTHIKCHETTINSTDDSEYNYASAGTIRVYVNHCGSTDTGNYSVPVFFVKRISKCK